MRSLLRHGHFGVLLSLGLLTACSGAEKDTGDVTFTKDSGSSTSGDTGGGGDDSGGITPSDDGGLMVSDALPTTEAGGVTCSGADPDCDGDGYPASKDCNDLEKTINPEAYDFPGDGIDNDCDGTKDNPVETCDPTVGSGTAVDFARAADLCIQHSISKKTGKPYDPIDHVEFGSVKGTFGSSSTRVNTATKILSAFGMNMPRKGGTLFGMQTGPILSSDPRGSTGMDTFPISNGCSAIPLNTDDCKSLSSGTTTGGSGLGVSINDYQEVRMFIRVPTNANAMSFDFAFFSSEFNEYWNSDFNDSFFVLVTSTDIKGANVAKDSTGKAITVNSGYFQLCPKAPGPSGLDSSKSAALANCVGVDGDSTKSIFGTLKGTNFDGAGKGSTDDTVPGVTPKFIYGGGSGWLRTKFGVKPGDNIVVRFLIHDTGDAILDSAAIVDNIAWDPAPADPTKPSTDRPPK